MRVAPGHLFFLTNPASTLKIPTCEFGTDLVFSGVIAMYLDLTDILRAPGTVTRKVISAEPGRLDDIELAAGITGWVQAENARRSIVVSGSADTVAVRDCARCLKRFPQPLKLELEACAPVSFFLAKLQGRVGEDDDEGDNELTADELAALFDSHTLDVLELVRQAIVLQTPIALLCAPDCTGLPEAGQFQVERDERWAALNDWQQAQANLDK